MTARAIIDWSNLDSETSFKGKDLSGFDFSGRMLVGANFSGCILHNSNFRNCDLSHANFSGADIYRGNFEKSILYATRFENSNLTRANFTEAKIYGFLIVGFCNITFSEIGKFSIEQSRRKTQKVSDDSGVGNKKFGERFDDIDNLCKANYSCNGYKIEFSSLSKEERHMQYSQVYNRLKRLFTGNSYFEEARECEFFERYHRTRSNYKYHIFTGERIEESDIRTAFLRLRRTFVSRVYESLAGYGLKPQVVLKNMVLAYLILTILMFLVLKIDPTSGVIYQIPKPLHSDDGKLIISQEIYDIGSHCSSILMDITSFLYFSVFAFFSFTFQEFIPYGHLKWMASLSTIVGISFLALLVTTFFATIRNS